jgi:hypothetical protein
MVPGYEQDPAKIDKPGSVQSQFLNRGAANWCQPNDYREVVVPYEVITPT